MDSQNLGNKLHCFIWWHFGVTLITYALKKKALTKLFCLFIKICSVRSANFKGPKYIVISTYIFFREFVQATLKDQNFCSVQGIWVDFWEVRYKTKNVNFLTSFQDPSQDSSVGREGPGFKSRQGREFFNKQFGNSLWYYTGVVMQAYE